MGEADADPGRGRAAGEAGSRALSAALVVGGLGAVLYRTLRYGGVFPDDTWITFRFAQHLADGAGLVWNLGGERVEGFTSPLHVWLLAAGRLAGVSLSAGSYAVSFAALLAIVALFVILVRRAAGRFAPEAALLLALYLVTSHLSVHVNGGLDTLLFMALLPASYAASLHLLAAPGAPSALLLAGANLLALLGRPDAAPFVAGQGAVLAVLAALRARRDGDASWLRATLASFALLGLAGGLYLAWKLWYFGYLLPNSYYVKASAPGHFAGAEHVKSFLEHVAWRYGIAVAPLFLLVSPGRLRAAWRRPLAREAAALLAVPPALFLLFYTTTLHAVCFDYRFEYPTVFFFCLASAVVLAVGAPLERVRGWLARRLPAPAAAALVALPVLVLPAWIFARHDRDDLYVFRVMQSRHYDPIAQALRRTGAGARGTVVFDSAGYIPFASGWSHIDPIGLTDNTLSGRHPITASERETYIWGSKPDVYLGPVPPATVGAESAADDPRVASLYVQKVLLRRAPFSEYRRIYAGLTPEQRRDVLYLRMRELRDHWVCVGEIPYPFPWPAEYTHFIYVRRQSPFAAALVRELEPLVSRHLAEFDFDDPLGRRGATGEGEREAAPRGERAGGGQKEG